MRSWIAAVCLAACAVTPPAGRSPAIVPATTSAPVSTRAPITTNPVDALILHLYPPSRGPQGEVSRDPATLWRELCRQIVEIAPGAEYDALLARGLAAAATWPDQIRHADLGWVEFWRAGRPPQGWPLIRSVAVDNEDLAKLLLAGDALAEVTELWLNMGHFADICVRAPELLDALAGARNLRQLRHLGLSFNTCVGPTAVTALGKLQLPALRRLSLSRWIGPKEAAALAAVPLVAQLEELDLSGNTPGADGLRALGDSPYLRGLATLRLAGSLPVAADGLGLARTPNFTGLRTLDIGGNPLTAAAIAALGRNRALDGLRELHLEGSKLDGEDLEQLVAEAGLVGLEILHLDNNRIGDRGLVAIASAKHWSLRALAAPRNGFGVAGVAALASSTHLDRLERLELANNVLGVSGGEALGKATLPHLRELLLGSTGLGDGGGAALLSGLDAPQLVTLDLKGASVGDRTALALAGRRTWTDLRVLDLGHNQIGDDGVVALAAAPQLAGLEILELRGNRPRERGLRALVGSPYISRFATPHWRAQLELHDTTLSPVDAARVIPRDFELRLRRDPCFGTCPVYTLVVGADGSVVYDGERYVRQVGAARARVDGARVRLILAAVDRFFATRPEDHGARAANCNRHISDYPEVRLEVHRAGEHRTFATEDLCPAGPAWEALFTLAERVDILTGVAQWTARAH